MKNDLDHWYQHILSLPVDAVIRPESDYEDYVQKRIAQFAKWRPNSPVLGFRFDEAISSTRVAHQAACALNDAIDGLMKAVPQNDGEVVDRVIGLYASTETQLGKRSENGRIAFDAAARYLRETVVNSGNYSSDMKIADVLAILMQGEPCIRDAPDQLIRSVHETLIRSQFSMMIGTYQIYRSNLTIARAKVVEAHIYRGLLYSGVINIIGSKLERDQLSKSIEELCGEVVSEMAGIPFVGVFNAGVNVIRELLNLGDRPDLIAHAEELENYITLYNAAVASWTLEMNEMANTFREVAEALTPQIQ